MQHALAHPLTWLFSTLTVPICASDRLGRTGVLLVFRSDKGGIIPRKVFAERSEVAKKSVSEVAHLW